MHPKATRISSVANTTRMLTVYNSKPLTAQYFLGELVFTSYSFPICKSVATLLSTLYHGLKLFFQLPESVLVLWFGPWYECCLLFEVAQDSQFNSRCYAWRWHCLCHIAMLN